MMTKQEIFAIEERHRLVDEGCRSTYQEPSHVDRGALLAEVRRLTQITADLATPHEAVKGSKPLVMYFSTEADRTEFIAVFQEVHPNARAEAIG